MNLISFITPILLSFFPILFLVSSNLGERITFGQISGTIIISGIFSFLATYIFSKILKNSYKSSIFICWLIIIFFSYGYLISFLSEITIFQESIGRHRYIGSLFLIITIIIFLLIKNSKKPFNNFISPILVSSLILISFNLIQIFIYYSSPRTEILEILNIEELETTQSLKNKPDVYHIILDMYPNEKVLQSRFDFNNLEFLTEMKDLGFNNFNGRSNYMRTKHSIPSTINLIHLNELNSNQLKSIQETEWSFKKSLEGYYAKKLGYKINHLSTNDPDSILGWMLGDFTRVLVKTSFLRIIEDSPIPINKLWIVKDSSFFNNNLNKLEKISTDQDSTWTFFYSRPPHPPFIFNQDGTLRNKKEYDQDFATNLTDTWSENTQKLYINQIEYVNKELLKTLTKILENSKVNPIILIHSDHGIHNFSGNMGDEKLDNTTEKVLEEHYNTLTTFYSVDSCEKIDNHEISNVNLIRTILRECFGLNISNINDNSYWSPRHQNKFIPVIE